MKELEDAEDAFALARLVEAVENQIADGHPREAGMVMMALLSAGEARQDALEQMAEVLAAHIAAAMENDRSFDINAYARDLLALPTRDEAEGA